MNDKCIFLAGNCSYSYIDLKIIDPSSLIDLHWSAHDNMCGNDNFPVINYKNDPLNTNCTENWKRNGLLDPIWKSLLIFFLLFLLYKENQLDPYISFTHQYCQ